MTGLPEHTRSCPARPPGADTLDTGKRRACGPPPSHRKPARARVPGVRARLPQPVAQARRHAVRAGHRAARRVPAGYRSLSRTISPTSSTSWGAGRPPRRHSTGCCGTAGDDRALGSGSPTASAVTDVDTPLPKRVKPLRYKDTPGILPKKVSEFGTLFFRFLRCTWPESRHAFDSPGYFLCAPGMGCRNSLQFRRRPPGRILLLD